jgi:hypothetical protein
MAVRGLKKIKVAENDCAVEDKGGFILITFDKPIKVDAEEVKEFKLSKPTLEDNEIAAEGADGKYSAINHMLSAYLEPKIAPDEFKDVFTIKEHGALTEIIGHFL